MTRILAARSGRTVVPTSLNFTTAEPARTAPPRRVSRHRVRVGTLRDGLDKNAVATYHAKHRAELRRRGVGDSGTNGGLCVRFTGTQIIPAITDEARRIARLSEAERAKCRRAHLGILMQSRNLLAGLTAEENVRLPLMMDGRLDEDRVEALLQRLGVPWGDQAEGERNVFRSQPNARTGDYASFR